MLELIKKKEHSDFVNCVISTYRTFVPAGWPVAGLRKKRYRSVFFLQKYWKQETLPWQRIPPHPLIALSSHYFFLFSSVSFRHSKPGTYIVCMYCHAEIFIYFYKYSSRSLFNHGRLYFMNEKEAKKILKEN